MYGKHNVIYDEVHQDDWFWVYVETGLLFEQHRLDQA